MKEVMCEVGKWGRLAGTVVGRAYQFVYLKLCIKLIASIEVPKNT